MKLVILCCCFSVLKIDAEYDLGCIILEDDSNRKTDPMLLKPQPGKSLPTAWYRCDAENHIKGETYLEITNFLHLYIINKKNMNTKGPCRPECADFKNTETINCGRNEWCINQPICPNIVQCEFMHAAMDVCLSNMTMHNRRYEYIIPLGQTIIGNVESCENKNHFYLETQIRSLFDICHYCFCLCEEGSTASSDIYVSLRTATSDIRRNRIVIGVRFVKRNQIVHFQVQEGQLRPFGQIRSRTERWVPVDDFKINDKNILEGRDYHKLTWKYRSMFLDNLFADEGSVITGVRFRTFGVHKRLHLEIVTTNFNPKTGELIHSKFSTSRRVHPDIWFKDKFGKELKLSDPDIPIRDNFKFDKYTTNKFVKFRTSDYSKDGGQSTVPFFDAQNLTFYGPLSGIGIFHRGRTESGGFITPVVFPYRNTT